MLLYCDSFDYYQTPQITRKWTGADRCTIIAGGGRLGSQGCEMGTLTKSFTMNGSTMIIGFSLSPSRNIVSDPGTSSVYGDFFLQVGTSQCLICAKSGALFVRDTLVIGTSYGGTAPFLSVNVPVYIEIEITFGTSTGTVQIFANGVSLLSLTGLNTNREGTGKAGSLMLGTQFTTSLGTIDDFYLCDGSGAQNNAPLGDVTVQAVYMDGNGDTDNFTPSEGTNWDNVAETLVDDDTTYNWTNTTGNVDLYTLASLPSSPVAIFGIQWNGQVRKTNSSAYGFKSAIKSSAVHYSTGTFTASTAYANYAQVYELNPDTGIAFTAADINGLQAGLKLQSIV